MADMADVPDVVEPRPYGTRHEHLAWAKKRALAYVDSGDLQGAFTSMASDLRKHPELADHDGMTLGMMEMMSGFLSTREDMRRHIEGYH